MNRTKYLLKELTPTKYQCIIGTCPAVYELSSLNCAVGSCPKLYEDENHQNYLIIGKRVNPKTFGLEEKVGKDETLISIPKDLLGNLNK